MPVLGLMWLVKLQTGRPASLMLRRRQPVSQSWRLKDCMARLAQVLGWPKFHAWLLAASNTYWGGSTLKHWASAVCTRCSAAVSSRWHFSALQRWPTMMGVVVTWRVRPLQTVGRPPASLSAYTTCCPCPSHCPKNPSNAALPKTRLPPRWGKYFFMVLAARFYGPSTTATAATGFAAPGR